MAIEACKEHARIITEVAFQPTARGGSTHFVTGNGRIVRQARELLDGEPDNHAIYIAVREEVNGEEEDPDFSREDAWADAMEEIIGLEKKHRGDPEHEQLIIRNQHMFVCPVCDDMVL